MRMNNEFNTKIFIAYLTAIFNASILVAAWEGGLRFYTVSNQTKIAMPRETAVAWLSLFSLVFWVVIGAIWLVRVSRKKINNKG